MQESSVLRDLVNVPLDEVSFEQLALACEALLPRASQLIGRAEDEVMPVFVDDRDWQTDLRGFLRNLIAELVRRDGLAAIEWVEERQMRLAELLLLEALPQVADAEVADRALQWLMAEPHRIRLPWSGSERPWAASQPAVERLTRLWSLSVCAVFEQFLLRCKEPGLLESMKWRNEVRWETRSSGQGGRPKFSEMALRRPTIAAVTLHAIGRGRCIGVVQCRWVPA